MKLKNTVKRDIQYITAILILSLTLILPFNNWMNSEEVIVLASEKVKVSPSITPTKAPLPTEQEVKESGVVGDITVKVSHYSPALGGVNCATFKNGKCVSKLANGEDWEKYIKTKNVIACPKELKLGTKIKILGRVWTCKDRGGKITKTESGAYWVDMLVEDTPVAYGTEVSAQIVK